jgi:hypothetical protein
MFKDEPKSVLRMCYVRDLLYDVNNTQISRRFDIF